MRRIFLDMEATDLPWTGRCQPFWVGLADEDGSSWSALIADAPLDLASDFVRSEILPLVPGDEPRLSGSELRDAVLGFCGDVDEFWAWCPSVEDIANGFGMGDAADSIFEEFWDLDLQLFRQVVEPWPSSWPTELRDLGALVRSLDPPIEPPPHDGPHNPRYDALWNLRAWEAARR